MLAAPIILSDYPEIAPESPGDLFDSGEIDQLLVLNILAMTAQERRDMRDSDPRAREILERTEALSDEQIMRLNGAVREFGLVRGTMIRDRPVRERARAMIHDRPPWEELERRGPDCVEVDGVAVRAGSLVRLRSAPAEQRHLRGRPGGTHRDRARGAARTTRAAFSSRSPWPTDPGQDLGALRRPGHRFFFEPREVEPLERDARTLQTPPRRVLVAGNRQRIPGG